MAAVAEAAVGYGGFGGGSTIILVLFILLAIIGWGCMGFGGYGV